MGVWIYKQIPAAKWLSINLPEKKKKRNFLLMISLTRMCMTGGIKQRQGRYGRYSRFQFGSFDFDSVEVPRRFEQGGFFFGSFLVFL